MGSIVVGERYCIRPMGVAPWFIGLVLEEESSSGLVLVRREHDGVEGYVPLAYFGDQVAKEEAA